MGVAFALVVGFVVSIGFVGPTVIFWRRQMIDSWKEVLGLAPPGTVPQTVPPSPVTRFRRSKKLVVFQSVVAIITALAAMGANDALAAVLLLLVSFVTCVSLGLSFLAWSVENAQATESA
jgi:hypothetical protein